MTAAKWSSERAQEWQQTIGFVQGVASFFVRMDLFVHADESFFSRTFTDQFFYLLLFSFAHYQQNFIPSTASNQIEMWQTLEEETIQREQKDPS